MQKQLVNKLRPVFLVAWSPLPLTGAEPLCHEMNKRQIMAYRVAPQETLHQLPGLFMTMITQISSVTAERWDMTGIPWQDLKRTNRKCPWQVGPRVGTSPGVSPFAPQHLSAHIFCLSVLLLQPKLPHLFPAHTLSTELEDNWPIFIAEWLFQMILETWIHSGLGRIQGEKMASLGIPSHQVKYTH